MKILSEKTTGFNKVIILGAGAVGSYVGSQLSRLNDVLLVGRKSHVEAINSRGLIVEGANQELYRLKAATQINEIPDGSLIIITTKAYSLADTVSEIKEFLRPESMILILQNGLGNEDIVQGIIESNIEIVRGITSIGVEFMEPGRINIKQLGEIVLPDNKAGSKLKHLFDDSGIPVRLTSDIRLEIWHKAAFNCVINPLTALFRVPNNAIASPSLDLLIRRIVMEIIQVAEMEGVTLSRDMAAEIRKRVLAYTNYSSMYQDIIKGKRTEIDFLNGRVTMLGRVHGIPTPLNDALYDMIKFMEEKR